MRRPLIAASVLVLAASLLTACASGEHARTDFSHQHYQAKVHYDSLALMSVVGIRDINIDRGEGFPRVQATVVNHSFFSKNFEYQIQWVDSSGFVVNPGSQPWIPLHLRGHESRPVQSTAPNADAQDFTIHVRKQDS